MTDRAISLLRTMLHPVLANLPYGAGRGRAHVPLAPHHAVPAIHLGGVILERAQVVDTAVAETMYGGIYDFAGERMVSPPDTVFKSTTASRAWRTELLRLDWLASFRASSKSLHGLFALRLLSGWMAARPHYSNNNDQITALLNLSIDAPAIAATQNPAAVAIATAAILQAQQPVLRIKPDTAAVAIERSIALLAAHLATRQLDSHRNKLIQEMTETLQQVIAPDGSHVGADIAECRKLWKKVNVIVQGLAAANEAINPRLAEIETRMSSYLALLMRPDGSLAFTDDTALRQQAFLPTPRDNALAETAGHARLTGGKTSLLASFGAEREFRPIQLEIFDGDAAMLRLEQQFSPSLFKREACSLICAAGGSLLEINRRNRDDARRHLALFLSGDGCDVRVEETVGGGSAATYLLHVPDQAKLSTTHGGAGAMIVLNATSSWQVLVRGGHIELDTGFLRIQPDSDTNGPLNFALKRARQPDRPARSAKSCRAEAERAPRLL